MDSLIHPIMGLIVQLELFYKDAIASRNPHYDKSFYIRMILHHTTKMMTRVVLQGWLCITQPILWQELFYKDDSASHNPHDD